MAPESESIESELKCVTRSASAQVKNCWRRSFASYLTCATADNGTKEKRGDWWKSASQTLVGRCGTCFWVVAVQVECVNPLGTTIEISTTKKVNTIQSRLLFTSALLLVIYIFTFSLFFFFFFFFFCKMTGTKEDGWWRSVFGSKLFVDDIIYTSLVLFLFYSFSFDKKREKVSTDLRECDNRAEWRGKALKTNRGLKSDERRRTRAPVDSIFLMMIIIISFAYYIFWPCKVSLVSFLYVYVHTL